MYCQCTLRICLYNLEMIWNPCRLDRFRPQYQNIEADNKQIHHSSWRSNLDLRSHANGQSHSHVATKDRALGMGIRWCWIRLLKTGRQRPNHSDRLNNLTHKIMRFLDISGFNRLHRHLNNKQMSVKTSNQSWEFNSTEESDCYEIFLASNKFGYMPTTTNICMF